MSEFDKRRPGFYRALPQAIPQFQPAIAQFQDAARQSLIDTVQDGDDLQWDRWNATIEYGSTADFDSILGFFVNLPSLRTNSPTNP